MQGVAYDALQHVANHGCYNITVNQNLQAPVDTKDFKRIGRILRELYALLKQEILDEGVDLLSPEYDTLLKIGQDKLRELVLEREGYTLQQYREAKALVEAAPKESPEVLNEIKEGIDAVRNTHIPSADEITELAKGVLPAPQVTQKTINKIVKETIVEKPTVIRETVVKNTIEKVDTSDLESRVAGLVERLDAMPNDFSENFEKNIEVLGMPDFRKLAMGLQAQIDEIRADITSDEAGDVDSVFGRTGTVVAVSGDYTTDLVTEATNLYFTNERAQDAVGNVVGNGLDYDDTTGAISVDETELTHNSLGSKQGGTAGEFYHLTSAQNTLVGALDADLATFSLPASTTISAFGATLVDDAAASNARTTLGLGTIATEPETSYALLAGRSGGQTIIGGTGSGDGLTLQSTSHATKGKILFGTSAYDEVNNRLGIGTASPAFGLDVAGQANFDGNVNLLRNMIRVPEVNGNIATFAFGVSGTSGVSSLELYADILAIITQATPSALKGELAFRTNRGDSVVEAMRIDDVGNVGIGTATFGTSAAKVLGIANGTEPSTSPADMIQIFSVDLSAGNATLGLRTETAVVTESVTSDRTLSVKINGTTYKICLKA